MIKNIDEEIINTIRMLSAESIQRANSGHPGLPLGAAPMAYTLWSKIMKHNPKNSKWVDRDRFILSAGHGSMLLYSLLYLFGYGLKIDDLMDFRQWDSKTPGHPEYGITPGVEVTTGPLGQGVANAVGIAISEQYMGSKFNRPNYEIVNHYTFALAGDGCMMEGISSEAASLAGTLALGKLIVLYDSNNISIEGSTEIAFRENVAKRYESYGWQVIEVQDGNDIKVIEESILEAKEEKSKPSIIIVKTQIGYGSPKQGTAAVHGEPLGEENLKKTKEFLRFNGSQKFYVSEEIKAYMKTLQKLGENKEIEWNNLFENYKMQYPDLAEEWQIWHSNKIKKDILNDDNFWEFNGESATRVSSGEIINRLIEFVPNLIGGSADLSPSTKTYIQNRGDFSKEDRSGANLHFGVREHAMAAIGNGIAVHGGLKIFVSTFFVFSDYMKGAMRLSALMKLPVIYILTHDSIGVGEDGPTHEPIEHLAALRSIPGFHVFRPADSKETAAAWYSAISREDGPTALILSRQNLPLYKETSKDALKGAYILKESKEHIPDIILMATGSEVQYIYEASNILEEKGISVRVISMPCLEIFDKQEEGYREKILPKNIRNRIAVEAAASFGWHKYIGIDGEIIAIDHFGASAPGNVLYKQFGITVDNIIEKALKLIEKK